MAEQEISPPESGEENIDLRELLGNLLVDKWWILGTAATVLLLGFFYLFVTTPIYSGNALLQVEQKQTRLLGGLDELFMGGGSDSPAAAEIEIIRSRSLLGLTVDRLALDVTAEPLYFPLIGKALARRYRGESPAEPYLGLAQFAWGGEEIVVQRLEVPASYVGAPLALEAEGEGGYTLYGPEGEVLLRGRAGQTAAGENGELRAEVFIAKLTARPGTRFTLRKRHREAAISSLQSRLGISEKGKGTGILQVSLEDADRERLAQIINTTAQVYIRRNIERFSEETQQTLTFLDEQLPQLKADLEAAEASLNEYRVRLGSIDLPLETQDILRKVAQVETRLSELDVKRAELRERFTDQHPAIITISQTRRQFDGELARLNGEIRAMPQEVQEAVGLQRDVMVAETLYLALLNKAQELKVAKAGTIGNVRLLDAAYPPLAPAKPKKSMTLALTLVLGLFLGLGLVMVRRFLHQGVEAPEMLEHNTGLPVYASVPHSEKQGKIGRQHGRKGKKNEPDAPPTGLLATHFKTDLAVESLRSLRTSLQFALLEAKNNVVAIAGPSPAIGKSFIAANLAALAAEAGKRVLLIDADMRKGHLHEHFGAKRTSGLSGVISGEISLEQAIRDTFQPNLQLLSCGIVPPNPAELLMSEPFHQLITTLSAQYDLVIIDTPPILAVTDSAIIGRLAGINFIVIKHGVHPLPEIQQTVKRLRQNGINPQGFIFNDVPRRAGRYGYGYGYQYQYSYK